MFYFILQIFPVLEVVLYLFVKIFDKEIIYAIFRSKTFLTLILNGVFFLQKQLKNRSLIDFYRGTLHITIETVIYKGIAK